VGLDLPVPPNARPATDSGLATPIDERAATPSAGADQAAPATPEPELPEIAKKADDLEAIKKAVEDAATVGGALWFSYLFVLFYLAVAAGAVTHADLFFENPVRLPFLNVELPLLAFFFLAPILFLIVHAYTLVHLVMLSDKAKRFHEVLHRQIGGADRAAIRAGLQRQLPSNIFVQFLGGPPDVRASRFGSLLRAIAWTTLVVAPVLLLLMMQIQFLPYHSSFITWTHRLALLADLILVWWLWRKILSGREASGRARRAGWGWTGLGLALSAGALLFSLMAATFPGEWQEDHLPSAKFLPAIQSVNERNAQSEQQPNKSFWDWVENSDKVSLHDWVFNSEVDNVTRRRRVPVSSTLVLPGLNIYEGLKIDDPDKAKWHEFIFRARGRDLKGAIFDLAALPKVDFEGAYLQGASLFAAQLQGASFFRAHLANGTLDRAHLRGVSLNEAELRGASLSQAYLQAASLQGAQLQGASLDDAQLQGASLNGARLPGASLRGAQLQGASLYNAELQGASLDYAHLDGASLDHAQLQAASLSAAFFGGASLKSAALEGASLQRARLEATDLSETSLWRTDLVSSAQPLAIPAQQPKVVVSAVIFRDSRKTWQPDSRALDNLRQKMESLPPDALRDIALRRVSSLDCAKPEKNVASCDPSGPTTPEAAAWRKALEDARVDDAVRHREEANDDEGRHRPSRQCERPPGHSPGGSNPAVAQRAGPRECVSRRRCSGVAPLCEGQPRGTRARAELASKRRPAPRLYCFPPGYDPGPLAMARAGSTG
jgi:uncharacterized protein YjbI with pentapeptide repeats